MSGGSYNYLYASDNPSRSDMEAMARRLGELGFTEALDETRALLALHPSPELKMVWQAVEWYDSADWNIDSAVRAYVAYCIEKRGQGGR